MSRTLLVVPCYNEAARLRGPAFVDFARRWPHGRFLFVDDGSTDETAALLTRLCSELPGSLSFFSLPQNQGKGEAVRQGVLRAFSREPQHVGFWDADLATPLETIPAFESVLAERPSVDVVIGARVRLMGRDIERAPLRHYLGRGFATAVSLALRTPVYDTQCGAKLFRVTPLVKEIFSEPFLSRWIFDVELFSRYLDGKARQGDSGSQGVYELPLESWMDVGGSKLRPHHFLQAALDLARITAASHTRRR